MNILKKSTSVLLTMLLLFGVMVLATPMSAVQAATVEENTVGAFNGSVTVNISTWYNNIPRFHSTTSSGYSTDAFCVEPAKAPPFTSSMTFSSQYISSVTNETVLNVIYYGYNAPGNNTESIVFNTGNNTYAKTPKGAMLFFRNRDGLGSGLSDDAYLYAFTHYAITYAMYGATTAFGVNPEYIDYTYKNAVTDYVAAITNGIQTKTLTNRKAFLRAYLINYSSGSQNIVFPVYRMRLEFDKVSTNPAFTNNNNLYSLSGAQFVLFRNNASAADLATKQQPDTEQRKAGAIKQNGKNTYIYTDSSGKGYFKNLGFGANDQSYAIVEIDNYFTVEFHAPMGYGLNNTYYGFVDSGEIDESGLPIFRVNSSAKTASGKPAVPNEPKLGLKIEKQSSNPLITDNNSCYHLANARYGVYDTKADAESNVNLRGIIITDEDGNGTYSNSQGSAIPAKDFWGKELTESDGYALDTEAHHFTYSGQKDGNGFPIYSFTSLEKPETDPITVLLQKYDAKTGKGTNTEKLANAEFTVKYYPAFYDSVEEIGENQPLRSWVFKTDSGGRINFYPEYFVSGDELWYQNIGGVDLPTIPYGTITVQETKAPDGYLINPDIYLAKINENNGNISWRTTNENVDGSVLQFPETPKTTETFITKTDITGSKEVEGATLTVSPVDNLSTVVDEWISTTEPHRIEGLEKGKEYILTEKIPADGYVTANSITFKVNEDGSPTYVTMKDDVTKIEIIKVNTNNQPLAGVELQILDNENDNVVIPTWKTDGNPYRVDGKLIVGKTYRLHEVSTLPNYTLADDVVFEVNDTPEIQQVKMVNALSTGSVTLNKKDGDGNELSGSEWELFTSDKKAVSLKLQSEGRYKVVESDGIQTMSTDEHGVLSVNDLTPGDYYFVEVKAPDGTTPYAKEIPFTISAENESTLHPSLTVKDNPVIMFNTGSVGVAPFYIAGVVALIVIAASICALVFIKKKKSKSKDV